MGLDQYAYSRTAEEMEIFGAETIPDFQWRKHPRLHRFMEALWKSKKDANDGEEFNNCSVRLHYEDIALLKSLVVRNKLPKSEGGFFFGHQYQDETAELYQKQDIQFCNWALDEIGQGQQIYYDSWW